MRSYIKIYGPPYLKAIKALERISLGMPEVCIMDTILATYGALSSEETMSYFTPLADSPIDEQRCNRIISKYGRRIGEFDFFFEWFGDPTSEQLNGLIERIDSALSPLGCRYTITTKSR